MVCVQLQKCIALFRLWKERSQYAHSFAVGHDGKAAGVEYLFCSLSSKGLVAQYRLGGFGISV